VVGSGAASATGSAALSAVGSGAGSAANIRSRRARASASSSGELGLTPRSVGVTARRTAGDARFVKRTLVW